MAISVKDLSYLIYRKIKETNPSILESLQLTEALNAIEKSIVKVPTLAGLPPAENNKGRMFFVEDIEDYRYSDGIEWVNDFTSNNIPELKYYTLGIGVAASTESSTNELNLVTGDWDDFTIRSWTFNVANPAYGIKDGILYATGSCVEKINTPISDWSKVVTNGWNHLAIRSNGTLWGWGCHPFSSPATGGAVGDGTTIARSVPVSVLGGFTDWCSAHTFRYTSYGLRSNGSLWAWGQNGSGQLGDGTTTHRSSPISISNELSAWCHVSVGDSHVTAINVSGNLWSWGQNNCLKLGNGVENRSSPVSVSLCDFDDWVDVSSGYLHNVGIVNNSGIKTLVTWGGNNFGQLGDRTTAIRTSLRFVQTDDLFNWLTVNAGAYSSAAIREPGELWTWGSGTSGQLGDGLAVNRSSPVTVVGGFTDWCQVSIGAFHSAATRLNGTLWSWGSNTDGQLGSNSIINTSSPISVINGVTNWCKVISGFRSTSAIDLQGNLWAWGDNRWGQIGDGTIICRSSPVSVVGGFTDWRSSSISRNFSAAIRSNGTLWTWGNNFFGQLGDGTTIFRSSPGTVIGGFTDWCKVGTTRYAGFGVRSNGTIWSWGENFCGRLGTGNVTCFSSPVSVLNEKVEWARLSNAVYSSAVTKKGEIVTWGSSFGLNHTNICYIPKPFAEYTTDWADIKSAGSSITALKENGTLWAWANNFRGQIGDGTTIDRSSPVSVIGGFTDWCGICKGVFHTIAIRTNGTIWAWGLNSSGQLGTGEVTSRTSPVSVVGGFTDWCAISSSENSNTAIRTNGTLWGWGSNFRSQLGDGTNIDRSSPVSVVGGFTDWCQVSTGSNMSSALRSNGTLWSWGANETGQLGDGTTVCRSSPVSVVGGFTDWCQIANSKINTSISTGIRSNGTLWTWGSNSFGQLGDGTKINRSSPTSVVGGFTDWCKAVDLNSQFSIFEKCNGTLWAIGGNVRIGETSANTCSPVEIKDLGRSWSCIQQLGNNFVLLKKNRSMWATGTCLTDITLNSFLPPSSIPRKFKDLKNVDVLSVGCDHNLAVKCDGTLWTWGCNRFGKLGIDSTVNKGSPASVVGGFTDWCHATGGRNTSAAIRTNGTLWAWGYALDTPTSSPINISNGFTDWCCAKFNASPALSVRRKNKGF